MSIASCSASHHTKWIWNDFHMDVCQPVESIVQEGTIVPEWTRILVRPAVRPAEDLAPGQSKPRQTVPNRCCQIEADRLDH